MAKNSGFHRKYIFNLQKPIPLRVWGRLGPVRVSQILPCFLMFEDVIDEIAVLECQSGQERAMEKLLRNIIESSDQSAIPTFHTALEDNGKICYFFMIVLNFYFLLYG